MATRFLAQNDGGETKQQQTSLLKLYLVSSHFRESSQGHSLIERRLAGGVKYKSIYFISSSPTISDAM
ncbi:predicted protein [Sclerotinia sclerotiorum 1980 UF-70]|uniref:Uncharacterized protein n=1 Tax=Sclerotinia sclerotiorum (strain ATCC 18683 / 1980 / Ss-1) TaxID=665079 RepID=A7EUS3_SCLS1|nr:predicted protein [Sclerotinia sclerotiorum 1980 UF-70]EDN93215.1 predicted protein [Sclerotinia sclerotiorum 1980 UF-70]